MTLKKCPRCGAMRPEEEQLCAMCPAEPSYTEDAIIKAFWKVWDECNFGGGVGNTVLYSLLQKLKG